MATIVFGAGNGNWNTDAAWVGGVKPTAADDAQLTVASGNCTIDAAAVCRSLDCNTYTGTLTHAAAVTLTIGDASAPAGNIALRLVAGMTYTLGNAVTSQITIASTYTAGQQTFTFGGQTLGNFYMGFANANNFALLSNFTQGAAATFQHTRGNIHYSGAADNSGLTHTFGIFDSSIANTRTHTYGDATINITATGTTVMFFVSTNLTIVPGTSTINFTGATSAVLLAGQTYNTLNFTGGGNMTTSGGFTCANLTVTGTAVKTDNFSFTSATITNSLTLNGNSATNRLLIYSSGGIGSARTVTNTGATLTSNFADYKDIALIVAKDLSAGSVGDCGGNSNITFTPAATQTWSGTTSGNWSTNAWTTRVPLPQDDVLISSAFSASQSVSTDMPRLGKSIDFSGSSGSPTWSTSGGPSMFGSLNMTKLGSFSSGSLTIECRTTANITSGGVSMPSSLTVNVGTYNLLDALTCGGGISIDTSATFNTNNFNVTSTFFAYSNPSAITMNLGSSTITCTGTGNPFATSPTTTVNAGSSTIFLSNTSASSKNFLSSGTHTYSTLRIAGGGSGAVTITGTNTFGRWIIAGGTKSIILPGSTTTTILSGAGLGNGTNLITFTSSAGSATIAKSGGTLSWDYVSLTNIPASGTAKFYAGPLTHSTDGGGNTNWIFSTSPGGSGGYGTGMYGYRGFNIGRFGRSPFA